MTTELNHGKADMGSGAQLSRAEQLAEVSVFLFLVVPSLLLSFFAIKQGGLSFVFVALSTILRDLALVGLIVFFAWRNGEPLERIGWTFKNGWNNFALGIVLFAPFFFGIGLIESILLAMGFSAPSTPLPSFLSPNGAAEFLLAIVLVLVVAVAEETIFRGYLVLRFKAVTGSSAAAVLLSAVIFSLGHGYEGSVGVITVGVMGLVLALIYLRRQSLVAPVVIHFLQDFLGIVLLPLLRIK